MAPAPTHGDSLAWSGGFLTRIDPRVKMVGVAGLLTANLLAGTAAATGLIAAAMLALMLAGRIPYQRQLIMIAFPATFALFAVASQTVFEGSQTVASLGPVDLHQDGFFYGLFIASRIVAGGLVVVVLGATTPLNRLCQGLRWFKVPATFVEVIQMAYRYLFDIHSEFTRMMAAQRSRLGWSSTRNGLASSRMLGGALFFRVYDRGLRSAEAMRCRGAGPLTSGTLPPLKSLDLWALLGVALLLVLVAVVTLAVSGR